MYTKFSQELSIKYPHDTEYPISTGPLDIEVKLPVLFEVRTTMTEMRFGCFNSPKATLCLQAVRRFAQAHLFRCIGSEARPCFRN